MSTTIEKTRYPAPRDLPRDRGPARRRVREHIIAWAPAVPLFIFGLLLLVLPAAKLINDTFVNADGSYGMDTLHETLRSGVNHRAFMSSLGLGAVQALLCIVIGTPVTWFISQMRLSRRGFWLAIVMVASHFGGIALAFGFITLFGTTGLVTRIVNQNVFPQLGSFSGLNIAYFYCNIALYVILLLPGMARLQGEWWEAAQTTSATRFQYWRYIGGPILAPFVAATAILLFTHAVSEYTLPYVLARGPQSTHLITLEIGDTLRNSIFNLRGAAVLSVVLMLLALVSMTLYGLALRRATRLMR